MMSAQPTIWLPRKIPNTNLSSYVLPSGNIEYWLCASAWPGGTPVTNSANLGALSNTCCSSAISDGSPSRSRNETKPDSITETAGLPFDEHRRPPTGRFGCDAVHADSAWADLGCEFLRHDLNTGFGGRVRDGRPGVWPARSGRGDCNDIATAP